MGLSFGMLHARTMFKPVFSTKRRAMPEPVLSDVPPSTEVTLTPLPGRVLAAAYRWPNFAVLHPTQA